MLSTQGKSSRLHSSSGSRQRPSRQRPSPPHCPHDPPQPSSPHWRPSQLGVQLPVQTPPLQVSPAAQAAPHAPQCAGSVARLTQRFFFPTLQRVSPVAQLLRPSATPTPPARAVSTPSSAPRRVPETLAARRTSSSNPRSSMPHVPSRDTFEDRFLKNEPILKYQRSALPASVTGGAGQRSWPSHKRGSLLQKSTRWLTRSHLPIEILRFA